MVKHHSRQVKWLVALVVFLALVLLASAHSSWVAFAETVPTPPVRPVSQIVVGPGGPTPLTFVEAGASTAPGSGRIGTSSLSVPGSAVPVGSTYTFNFWDYSTSAVPTGNLGAGFKAPGDNQLGVLVTDQYGNVIHSLLAPGMTVCFSVGVDQYNQTNESDRYNIQWWSGSAWVKLPTTITGPTGGFFQFCTTVTTF